METILSYEKEIETYIRDSVAADEEISFNKFVKDNSELIINNTAEAQWDTFENVWRARIVNIAKAMNINMTKENIETATLCKLLKLNSQRVSKPKTPKEPQNATSYINASKTNSHELTEEAKVEYRKKFESMIDEDKWTLREGVVVEDIMYEFGKSCTHEHAAHSFILNTSDPCWRKVFSEKDFKTICTQGNFHLPELDEGLIEIFEHYRNAPERSVLDFVIEKTEELGPFHPRYQTDQYKLLHAIQQFVGYYIDETLVDITLWTEQDFVTHVWCILDRFFQSSRVTTTRNKTCLATAQRINGERLITGDSEISNKRRSSQPDLTLLKNGLEYGTSKVGKDIDTVVNKKEIIESQLHSSKTIHDMLCAAHKKTYYNHDTARDLKIVCFNETGLTLFLSIMDCPKGYVSRIIETQKYEIPRDSDLIIGQLFPILKLTLQAKEIVDNSLRAVKKHLSKEQEPKLTLENNTKTLKLPSSLTSPILPTTTAQKKRKQDNSSESSASTLSSKRRNSDLSSTTSS